MVESFKAQRKYVGDHIDNAVNKKVFNDCCDLILSELVQFSMYPENDRTALSHLKYQLNNKKYTALTLLSFSPPSRFTSVNPEKYCNLAFELSEDLRQSFASRFVIGGYRTKNYVALRHTN
jgi:hypothetical protein